MSRGLGIIQKRILSILDTWKEVSTHCLFECVVFYEKYLKDVEDDREFVNGNKLSIYDMLRHRKVSESQKQSIMRSVRLLEKRGLIIREKVYNEDRFLDHGGRRWSYNIKRIGQG